MATKHPSHITTDHEEIHRWVEERGGKPAVVKRTHEPGKSIGILRIDLPRRSGEQVEQCLMTHNYTSTRMLPHG